MRITSLKMPPPKANRKGLWPIIATWSLLAWACLVILSCTSQENRKMEVLDNIVAASFDVEGMSIRGGIL